MRALLRSVAVTILPAKYKGLYEFGYWVRRKLIEGTLSNEHYEYFFTEHFEIQPSFYAGKRILDIGCGPRGSLEWAGMAAERVGLDPLAAEYLRIGAAKHSMRYVSTRSEDIPFPDSHFDVVSSFNSLDHVDDLEETVAEVSRVLRAGGLFLLLTDVNHEATLCEPVEFSWDVLQLFEPTFFIRQVRQYERSSSGLFDSLQPGIPYDHSDEAQRYGILSAKLVRRDDGDGNPS